MNTGADFMKHIIEGDLRRASHIRRYATIPVHRVENVAEHTHYVSSYCVVMAHFVEKFGEVVDWRFLMTASTFHDVDESMSGDVLRKVKRSSSEFHQMWNKMCSEFVKEIGDTLPFDLHSYWSRDKDMTCVEGQIISLADFLSVISYGLEEYNLGNANFKAIVEECIHHIKVTFQDRTDEEQYSEGFSALLEQVRNYLSTLEWQFLSVS